MMVRLSTVLFLFWLSWSLYCPSVRASDEDLCDVSDDESRDLPRAWSVPGLRAGSFRYTVGNGFSYHRQRASSGRIFLRCVLYRSNPSCPVRAVMNEDLSGFLITGGQHNHGADELHQQVQDLRNSLIQACRVRPNIRVDVIYHDVCRNVPRDVSSRISLLSIRPAMIRTQSENRPNIPNSFEEFDELLRTHDDLRTSLDGETNLYQGMTGVQGHRSLLFLTRRVAIRAGDIRHLFGDGTFYARPNLPDSAQLYTLVTVRDNHILPLAYALMESRSELAYRDLFTFIRRTVPELDPDFIMTDFETSQQNAFVEVFPRARLAGCLFHYSRAVCRNVRSLGLHGLVRDSENARRIVRLTLAIPMAPPGRLFAALNAVVMEARRLNVQDQFRDLFNYLRVFWLEGVGERVLCVFGVRHRTNNVAEAHHRNINSRVVRRPNVWRFIEMLREMEDVAWRDLGRLEQGVAPSRARRMSSLMSDARIRSCSRQVVNREMDLLHFLSSVSWHLDNSLQETLRERNEEEEGRPPSPLRGPPPVVPDNVRLGSEHLGDSLNLLEEVQCHDTFNDGSQDNADLFEDLMEDNSENARPPRRSRARAGRGGRRGRRRASAVPMPVHRQRSASVSRTSRSLPLPASTNRSQLHPPLVNTRCEDFSDGEEVDENAPPHVQRWHECLLCYTQRGRYTLLGCGAFPVCGQCIRQWFINLGHANCPHCGGRSFGWVRLNLH